MKATAKLRGLQFSDPMVKALLDGAKLRTRRLPTPTLSLVRPGDVFYVREALVPGAGGRAYYRTDGKPAIKPCGDFLPWKWGEREVQPPMYMPRAYARLLLLVGFCRRAKLQAMDETDAQLEGFRAGETWSALAGFMATWDTLHPDAPHRWVDNPEVFELDFTVQLVPAGAVHQ